MKNHDSLRKGPRNAAIAALVALAALASAFSSCAAPPPPTPGSGVAKPPEEVLARYPGLKSGIAGLWFEILEAGTGSPCGNGRVASVLYELRLPNDTVLDSSEAHGGATLDLSTGKDAKIIEGFRLAVSLMRVGEKRRVAIPPALGYGEAGIPGLIPPNSWLVFVITLVAVR